LSVVGAFAALTVPVPGTCDDDPKPFSEWIELSRGARVALDRRLGVALECRLALDVPLALELALALELGCDVPPAEPPPEAPPLLEEPLGPPFEPVPEEEPPPSPELERRRWGAASARAASRGMA